MNDFSYENDDPDAPDSQVVGLVTATDAFEAITGDLRDPLDLKLPHVD